MDAGGAATRILVVDDNSDNTAYLESLLRTQRFEVETCESGAEALAAVDRCPPALVLLDVMMPGMDGYAVARRIRANPDLPFIPIILVTAKTDLSDKIHGLEQGADDFLTKPVNGGELLARVRALLRLKAAQDGLQRKTEELTAVNSQLKQSEALREELVSMITHDLRGPLTGLVGSLGLLDDGTLGPLRPDQRQFVRLALGNCTTLDGMIGDILAVYRMESGNDELAREPLSPTTLIAATCQQIAPAVAEAGLQLIDATTPDPPLVEGDRRKLLRVLSNLVSNALKYTDQGSITISAQPCLIGERPGVRFGVVDTGAGVPEADRAFIFEKFYRVASSGGKNISGTGLGLNFCKQIVAAHGGAIWVESGPNEVGSAFYFTIPAVR